MDNGNAVPEVVLSPSPAIVPISSCRMVGVRERRSARRSAKFRSASSVPISTRHVLGQFGRRRSHGTPQRAPLVRTVVCIFNVVASFSHWPCGKAVNFTVFVLPSCVRQPEEHQRRAQGVPIRSHLSVSMCRRICVHVGQVASLQSVSGGR